MTIHLIDDGTMDTVLRCSECGEEIRGMYDPCGPSYETGEPITDATAQDDYDAWVDDFIAETVAEHVCQSDDDL